MYDLLGAAVQALEEDPQRNLVLSAAPVDGHQRAYLENVAFFLTERMSTNCTKEDALQTLYSSATRLAERHIIGALPDLASVLDVLAGHHLLHLDDGYHTFSPLRTLIPFSGSRCTIFLMDVLKVIWNFQTISEAGTWRNLFQL